ncbi:MAG TPA: XdhC family protein [Acidimicrobiia bacterium]|nr:XdhC family protein [Acidimicrobiia bacterium]
MDTDVLAEAVELARARVPFALATVVWRRGPSSGHVGSKAVVLGDGTVRGWLGGACAEPTMIREALAALEDGMPRRLFLGAPDELAAHDIDETITVPMACESEGAMEIYLEPSVPAPQVVVIGRSPAVHALTVQARSLGWDVAVIDDGGAPDEHPVPELVRTTLDLTGLGIGPSSAIVVATQGHYDDLALRAALDTDAGYIGVVAAEKRASSLLELLRGQGVGDDALARVHAPAGLDLGPVDNAEIAVAVLADLVARRAAGQLRGAATTAPREAVDPVCGMTVFVDTARYHTVHDGSDYWFCASACLHAFETNPETYAKQG